MQVQSLVVGNAAHSSILAWKISQTEEPGRLTQGHKESDTTEHTRARAHTHTHTRSSQGHQLIVCPVSTGINTPMDNMLAFTHMDTCACL